MKTVRQLLETKNAQVVSVCPEESVFSALQKMADNNVGAVLVTEAERLVGIFSERDYARRVVLKGRDSKETTVKDIMTEKVLYVTPERTTDEAMAIMTDKRCRHLPVLDADNKIVGIVSIGDLVKEALAEQEFIIKQLEAYIAS